MNKVKMLLAAMCALALPSLALAGIFGYPSITTLTGAETIPLDTNYSGGRSPQTAIVTVDGLKTYAFGNAGVASATANGTATATGGAATLNSDRGTVTSEALTTAAAGAYTLTVTNSTVLATSVVVASVDNGTNTQGIPTVGVVTPSAGSLVIKVNNLHASQALNGTLKVRYLVVN